jgi:transposase-like protein
MPTTNVSSDTTEPIIKASKKDIKAARSRPLRNKAERDRLTPEIIAEAAKLRLGGMRYSLIAKQLGVKNTGHFRESVSNAMKEYLAQIQGHLQTLMVIDLMRIEEGITAQFQFVLDGSEKHFQVMLKAIQLKQEIAARIANMQLAQGNRDDPPTITTDDETYYAALRAMNSDNPFQQLLADNTKSSDTPLNQNVIDAEGLDEKEIEQLQSLAEDLQITASINEQQNSGDK